MQSLKDRDVVKNTEIDGASPLPSPAEGLPDSGVHSTTGVGESEKTQAPKNKVKNKGFLTHSLLLDKTGDLAGKVPVVGNSLKRTLQSKTFLWVARGILGIFFLVFLTLSMGAVSALIIKNYEPDIWNKWNAKFIKYETFKGAEVSTVTGSDYNKYTKEISQLNLAKILKDFPQGRQYSAAEKGLTSYYWNTGYSPYSDILTYLLLTDVVSRNEINNSAYKYQIIPAYALGDWHVETSNAMGTNPDNLFASFDTQDNSGDYIGFWQENPKWFSGGADTQGYLYISKYENTSLNDADRAYYGLNTDTTKLHAISNTPITSGGPTLGKVTDASSFIKVANGSYPRPSADNFSDALYTFNYMLRVSMEGLDLYSFKASNTQYDGIQKANLEAWISTINLNSEESSNLAYAIYNDYNLSRIPADVLPSSQTTSSAHWLAEGCLALSDSLMGIDFTNEVGRTPNQYNTMSFASIDTLKHSSTILNAMKSIESPSVQQQKQIADYAAGKDSSSIASYYGIFALNAGIRMQQSLEYEIDVLYNAAGGKYRNSSGSTGNSETASQAYTSIRSVFGNDRYAGTSNTRGGWGCGTAANTNIFDELSPQPFAQGTDSNYSGEKYVLGAYPSGGSALGVASCSDSTDCSGLTGYVYMHAWNIQLTSTAADQWQEFQNGSSANGVKLSAYTDGSSAQAGDLVFFSTEGGSVSHVGIYIGNGWMISAENPRSKILVTGANTSEGPDGNYWKEHIVGYGHPETHG